LKRREKWMTNCYVIDDPTTPENEGSLKILRYGKQLDKIIKNAISGKDADEFGAKIFDLSKKGCNLRVSVENNSEGNRSWPTYVMSKFTSASEIDGMTDDKIAELHENVIALEEINPVSTYEELQETLSTQFSDVTIEAPAEEASSKTEETVVEKKATVKESAPETVTEEATSDSNEDDLNELLAGLED
ncbi:MAG: hypothetical protein ACXADH_17805, partial [Candidatus Kariarchaeaceae archaeon]